MRTPYHASVLVEPLEIRQLFTIVPTANEQYMLELINRARANPTAEAARYGIDLNEGLPAGTISSDAKQPLAFNPALIDSARTHSQWMINTNTFSHTGANGTDPGDRMGDAGYSQTGSYGWGENIAYRSQSPDVPEPVSTTGGEHSDLFIDAGVAGRGHRTILLDPDNKEVGVGIATGVFQGYNALMTTQDFAYEDGNSFVTGVAYSDTVTHDNFYTPAEGIGNLTITAKRESDNALFTTTTWSTGGYTIQVPAGTYTITATGSALAQPLAYTGVVVANQNVKRDFVPASASPTPSPAPSPTPTPTPTPAPTPTPTPSPTPAPSPTPTPSPSPSPAPALTGTIAGRVYNDVNGNGKKEGTDPGTSALRVFLDANNNGVVDDGEMTVSPGTDGSFQFNGVTIGMQHVRIESTAGWRITLPVGGTQEVIVRTGKTVKLKPLAATQSVRLLGSVFEDANGSGTLDAGEVAAKKRRVYADVNGDGAWEKGEPIAPADKVGNWILNGLSAGDYSIRVVAKKGFQSTLPGGALPASAETGGGTFTGFLLGEHQNILAQQGR